MFDVGIFKKLEVWRGLTIPFLVSMQYTDAIIRFTIHSLFLRLQSCRERESERLKPVFWVLTHLAHLIHVA